MDPHRLLMIIGSCSLTLVFTFLLIFSLASAAAHNAPTSPTTPTVVSFQGKVTAKCQRAARR